MINIEARIQGRKISEDEIEEVAICLDNTGIDVLCTLLQKMKSYRAPNHIHLSTEKGCGEEDLDSSLIEESYTLVNQLRIVKIAD